MDINYSVSFGDSQQRLTQEKLWAFCGVDVLPSPDGTVLLRKRDDDRRQLVRRDVAAVLDQSRAFSTLSEHALAAGALVPELAGHPERALPVLQQMAEHGYLRDAESVLRRLKCVNNAAGKAQLPDVHIITCDRPAAIKRLLGSLGENKDNHAFAFTLIDDSRDATNVRANARLVDDARDALNLNIRHFGPVDREKLIGDLNARCPEHTSAVKTLFDRGQWGKLPTYGLARNVALLLSAGHRMIILDDDIIATALPSPGNNKNLAFGTANSRRLAFFDNQKTAITSPKSGAQSPLRLTEAVLGSSLGALLTQQQADTDSLRGAVGDDWFDLAGTARVAVTQCGTFGEPGTGTRAHWIINLAPEDIEALLSQPDPIEQTLAKQAMWMGYPSQTVTRLSSMSAVTGLDHRELLPPYFPALRGEDFLFSVMLEVLAPDAVVAGCNWGVPHLPINERPQPSLKGTIAAGANLSSFAHWLGARAQHARLTRRDRLLALAGQIDWLHGCNEQTLINTVRSELTKQHLQQLNQIRKTQKATRHIKHDAWQAFISAANRELVETLQTPFDLNAMTAHLPTPGSFNFLRQMANVFASAMRAWPDLVESHGMDRQPENAVAADN